MNCEHYFLGGIWISKKNPAFAGWISKKNPAFPHLRDY
ncbi:hypothetical protein SeGA_1744 [Salmonella enterica subsp. enterica serovar Gaminara str. A4-567]|nr:hypothetical protein SeGA_1744 [Salmonella enterica subsp. enterica serovar Gaminara str. A4-567]